MATSLQWNISTSPWKHVLSVTGILSHIEIFPATNTPVCCIEYQITLLSQIIWIKTWPKWTYVSLCWIYNNKNHLCIRNFIIPLSRCQNLSHHCNISLFMNCFILLSLHWWCVIHFKLSSNNGDIKYNYRDMVIIFLILRHFIIKSN